MEVKHIVILLTLGDAHVRGLAQPARAHEFLELGRAYDMAAPSAGPRATQKHQMNAGFEPGSCTTEYSGSCMSQRGATPSQFHIPALMCDGDAPRVPPTELSKQSVA